MTFGSTRSAVLNGIEAMVVDVEVSVAPGLPKVVISGCPDAAISQSPNRLRSAMAQSELTFPDTRLAINLAPAAEQKSGAGLDLAMAVAVLSATGQVQNADVRDVVHLGELGMDGTVRPIRGILPACLAALNAGVREVVVPYLNADEAALVWGLRVRPVKSLSDVVALHRERARGRTLELPWPEPEEVVAARHDNGLGTTSGRGEAGDLADVVGQHEARAALEVAAAGGHNVSMIGPPGAGKTLLASRLPGLLPPLSREESLAVTSVQSILGVVDGGLVERAPFVAPHHGTTMPALVGGGPGRPRPGAITQAHAGVLFLDEAPEFRREVLDALRQPLERGYVTIARSQQTVRYPCRFQLVLASNPCPCGRYTGNGAECTCVPTARRRYLKRLSGPLLDRIDVHLHVPAVTRADLAGQRGESSADVAARVAEARERARRRWEPLGYELNARVPGSVLRSCPWGLEKAATSVLDHSLDRGTLTLRGYDRTLRLAWTVGDLRGAERPSAEDVHMALTLREGALAA